MELSRSRRELGTVRRRRLPSGRDARHDKVMAREIVLDTETTGFDPLTGDRLVELAALEIESFVPTGRSFHVYIDPLRDMPAEAEKVHGLSSTFRALSAWPALASERLNAGFAAYFTEESSALPTRSAFNAFKTEVAQIEERVARLDTAVANRGGREFPVD